MSAVVAMGVVVGVAGAPFSLTMFLHEDNLSSKAPTFRNKSPTMFKADNLADGVSVLLCLGDVFEEDGGVSKIGEEAMSFSPLETSAACLFESGLDFPFRLLFLSIFICSKDLSLSGGLETGGSEVLKTLSSDRRSRVSSFILWTAAFNDSFSSSSDSKKAFLSIAEFIRPSKSSSEASVLLGKNESILKSIHPT